MKFRYSVARYVPSVIRDEAINIGVLLETVDEPGLYVQFLGALSRIRTLFPDADMATLRLLRTYFKQLSRPVEGPEQQFAWVADEGPSLDKLFRDCAGSILQLSPPRVTIGDNANRELADLFKTLVSSPTSTAVRPISAVQLAPAQLRKRVDTWFAKAGWLGPHRFRRGFELRGTVFSWAFDFGLQNGHVTVVQTVALGGPVEPAMNRALLLTARAEDVAKAQDDPTIIVVADKVESRTPPVRYLNEHGLDPIPAQDHERLSAILSQAAP
jgi:hypothetical protein